ncbi:MAG TPA: sodium/solute symporter [Candidatus Hydrogenedentes bacterium]|nr:sodium/solute symporter [Candidatus Hydrogenedentota bacterium]HOV74214.1 sodium/solute symporter [Candidatus Hydrogenedentota bacterium]HPC15756.1 sodium/solute symporter [Candidatus Hydrogenedentota bacterium]HRT19620.1 sodium/solute symporter [Candidatus Hydrogenedentota bacterium]HRT64395.1 sodium/solute symporter [Candidatus Hydrogenedentota bacterium]
MTGFTVLDWVILVVYFLAMASMGPIFARRGRTTEGYFLGNRSFPGWLIGLSMFATSISSITFMAYPADAYKTAYLRFLPCLMLPLGVFLASLIFLPFYRKAHVVSAFEYLEGRFGPGVRLYAALMFVFGQLIRLSLILYLVSLLVRQMTGLDPYVCILIGGVITSFYTIMGGIEAVIWTDFFQSFLLWGGGFACLFLAVYHIDGGLATVIKTAFEDGKFMLGDLNSATGSLERAAWGFSLTEKTVLMMLLVGLTGWLTEYSSNQNVIQKYCASKNPREATKAIWICCLCSVPTWAFFMFLGTTLYVFFKFHPTPEATAMLTGAQKADQILPYFVVKYLPPGVSGLVIAGVLAAAMSSLSSSINAVSAVSIVDIYKRHVARNASERNYVIAAKAVSMGASVFMVGGAAALMMANSKTLQDTATKLGALTAGGLLGLYLLGFLTKRGDGRAVAAGIVCTLIFSAWISLLELGWVTKDVMQTAWGLPAGLAQWLSKPIDTYYAGMVGNLLMFVVAFALAGLWWSKPRDLTNLTVWTTDDTPLK